MAEQPKTFGDIAREAMNQSGMLSPSQEESKIAQDMTDFGKSKLLGFVKSRVEHAKNNRSRIEGIWYRATQAFKGIDTSKFRNTEVSDVYLRTTTVKTRSAYSQIVEALFSDGRFPIEVTSTEVPLGISEFAHLTTEQPNVPGMESPEEEPAGPIGGIGFAGDGFDLKPGATFEDLLKGTAFLGGFEEEYTDENGETPLKPGPARQGEPQIALAKETARRLDKLIQDQLTGSKARDSVRKSLFECCLLGTGALKGPFNIRKKLHRWVKDPETGQRVYKPVEIMVPMFEHVSIWNLYVDPNAACHEDAEWMAQKHRMTPSQLGALKRRPHFDHDAIDELLAWGGNYTEGNYESQLRGNQTGEEHTTLFEVYEYWGYVNKRDLEDFDLDIPPEAEDFVQVNVWYSGNKILRVVLNPFLPQRIPYFIFPYEQRPYELYGIGVPESMEDTQKLINGFARMAIDNLALAGNLMVAIDDTALIPGQDDGLYPGKVWRIVSGTSASQAIQPITFPNTAPENLQLMREFRQQADESTGIPSIAHGQTGVSGFGRTSSGMSMLLQNASLNIKTVIRNIDDYLLKPMGQSLFQWNMQFSLEDFPEIQGDLEIKARGSQALQMKEVRSQRLQTFLQISANPALAPLIRLPTIIRELAIAMEMDPEEIINSPEEQRLYAELMGIQGMQQPGAPSVTVPPVDAPLPGDPAFTGNDVSAGNPEGVNGQVPPEALQ